MWYLYIVQTEKGFLYTGISVDVEKRFAKHQSGKGAKYLRGKGELKLLRQWSVGSVSEALKMEIFVKKMSKNKKLKLVESGKLPILQ